MFCKNCGNELPDGVTFCNLCGKRLDGKINCPHCNTELPEESRFCYNCGKSVIKPDTQSETAAADAAASPNKREWHIDWKKILNYVDLGFAAFAALMGFIFTFCIGVSIKFSDIGTTITIYDYFGKAYGSVGDSWTGTVQKVSAYAPTVISTVIAACAIICNIVFASITSANSVKKYVYKKENVNIVKPALLTYFSFATFASLFLAANSASQTQLGINVGSQFSGATTAGLVLGGIAVAGYFVSRAALRIKEFLKPKEIINSALAVLVCVLSVISVGLMASPAVTCVLDESKGYETGLGFLQMITASAGTDKTSTVLILCFGLIGFAAWAVMTVLFIKTILSSAQSAVSGEKCKALGCAIANVALSGVQLAAAIVAGGKFGVNVLDVEKGDVRYGIPIALTVLSVLVLGAVIALKVFASVKVRNDAEV